MQGNFCSYCKINNSWKAVKYSPSIMSYRFVQKHWEIVEHCRVIVSLYQTIVLLIVVIVFVHCINYACWLIIWLLLMSGLRKLEAFFAFLITVMALSFGYEVRNTSLFMSCCCLLITAHVNPFYMYVQGSSDFSCFFNHGLCNICEQFPE